MHKCGIFKLMFHADFNIILKYMSITGDRTPGISLRVDQNIYLTPYQGWALDYIEPKIGRTDRKTGFKK